MSWLLDLLKSVVAVYLISNVLKVIAIKLNIWTVEGDGDFKRWMLAFFSFWCLLPIYYLLGIDTFRVMGKIFDFVLIGLSYLIITIDENIRTDFENKMRRKLQ